MQKPKVTSKGQTTLPTAVRAALKIDAGDTLRYIVSGGEVRILKARYVTELSECRKDQIKRLYLSKRLLKVRRHRHVYSSRHKCPRAPFDTSDLE